MQKVYTSFDICLPIAFLVTGWHQNNIQWCVKQYGSTLAELKYRNTHSQTEF